MMVSRVPYDIYGITTPGNKSKISA